MYGVDYLFPVKIVDSVLGKLFLVNGYLFHKPYLNLDISFFSLLISYHKMTIPSLIGQVLVKSSLIANHAIMRGIGELTYLSYGGYLPKSLTCLVCSHELSLSTANLNINSATLSWVGGNSFNLSFPKM